MSTLSFDAPLTITGPECKCTPAFAPGVYDYATFFSRLVIKALRPDDSGVPWPIEHAATGAQYWFDKIIGTGSQGTVLQYKLRTSKPMSFVPPLFCLKMTTLRDDALALEVLAVTAPEVAVPFRTVRSQISRFDYVAMPAYDGDLIDLVQRHTPNFIRPDQAGWIMCKVLEQIAALDRHGLSYMDVKCENILYSSCGNPPAEVYVQLGDLGSVSHKDSVQRKMVLCTYPPPEHADLAGGPVPQDPACCLWATGLMFLAIMGFTDATNPELSFNVNGMRALYLFYVEEGFDAKAAKSALRISNCNKVQTWLKREGLERLLPYVTALMGTAQAPSTTSIQQAYQLFCGAHKRPRIESRTEGHHPH